MVWISQPSCPPLHLTSFARRVILAGMNHDQRFKTLIRTFFVDFLLLFFADWAARLDLTRVEWLDQELFPDPPEGSRHAIDLVAKVAVAPTVPVADFSLLLLHIEIESPDRTTNLKSRLPYYFHFLRDKHQLPVVPLVLYLHVGLDGLGTDEHVEKVWDFEVNRFRYLYVGLPGLDGLEYVQGDNWLGVALSALMRIPRERVVWLGAEALRRLAGAPLTEQQRFLLGECVEAYLPLDDQKKQELVELTQTETYREASAMNETSFEKGRRVELLATIVVMIEQRFGPVSAGLRQQLEQRSLADLRDLVPKIIAAASLADLRLPVE